MNNLLKVCLLGLFLGLAHRSLSQSSLAAYRMPIAPSIDGVVDPSEWKDVPSVEGLFDVNDGTKYPDSGRFWLGYDKTYVYFAAQLVDSDPASIHATEYRTNVGLSGDDSVELDLDLSGSLNAFNIFLINPNGATNISIAGGRAAKREWLGAIVAKGRITATGWECEARIPWRAMDIPKGGKRNVRFNCFRFLAKSHRYLASTFVPQTKAALTPTWIGVELPKPEVDHSIKLLPYGYVGYDARNGGLFNGGVDMKTALTDQVNMVGSINPDFKNIENSVLSLDFSHFERIGNETRPFFQEGKRYGNSPIFTTQRIHEFSTGLNTFGRINDKTSFSIIGATLPGRESDLAFTVSENPNPSTAIRFTATDLERPGFSNKATFLRLSQDFGNFNISSRLMGSQDSVLGTKQQSDLNLSYSKNGLNAAAGWTRSDKGFSPKLGFVPETNYSGPGVFVDYDHNLNRGVLSDFNVSFYGVSYNRIDGTYYRKEGAVGVSATIRPGVNIRFSADLADFLGQPESLYSMAVSFPRGNPYTNIGAQLDQGMQGGFPYHSLTVSSSYRAAKKLQFSVQEQHVDYQGAADQTIITSAYDLGNDRSIAGRLVKQNSQVNAYLAYQRSGNEGIEYFLILGDPNAPTYRNSLTLKLVIPITLGRKPGPPVPNKG
jgi:hypothetical protein